MNAIEDQRRNAEAQRRSRQRRRSLNINPTEEQRRRRAETQRLYRQRRRLLHQNRSRQEHISEIQNMDTEQHIVQEIPHIANNIDFILFQRKFTNNDLGHVCNVCDRIWFKEDLRAIPNRYSNLLAEVFPNEDVVNFKLCQTCHSIISRGKIPRLSKSNGFKYPQYPQNLPPLDIISERLISPRIPFMQIRRLRYIHGSKSLIGQVINVPVDVNNMFRLLPRQLDDDHAFNVHIKRHLIHRSSYLQGMVKKSTVKAWLNFLLQSTLYRQYNIKIDDEYFRNENDCPNHVPSEEMVEPLTPNPQEMNQLLLAQQHTLMWNEDRYLSIAPGMNERPLNIVYDEHAEELAFPSIYLGEPRRFLIENVTPFMIAASEIRRKDRRGVKPEHVLYMAMKIMRIRVTKALQVTFKNSENLNVITRQDVEDPVFIRNCMNHNFAFMKSIPNSAHYWLQRKMDVFSMIRQLGKPTIFLTLSASEYQWDKLIKVLYKFAEGHEYNGQNSVAELSAQKRTDLVNNDPVTCCLYFNKLVDTIMNILTSARNSPFQQYKVKDWFKRIEFQQRGSPHAHILLWLENDPKEEVSENMPRTVALIDSMCSVNENELPRPQNQTHKHTFTCYKNCQDQRNNKCRFGAPFWPVNDTIVLIPMPQEDGRRLNLKKKYDDMHRSLEFEDFDNLQSFLDHHGVQTYENYLNILKAGIARPRIFLKRSIKQCWINSFNPWIATVLNSNMDIQFILEPYSCATYVVEYVNKTNRGISNLQRELLRLRDEYPDMDYTDLIKSVGISMLNSVEISCQEAAWYLLNLHMSESSRKIEFIQTSWPQDRKRVRKSYRQLEEEEIAEDSNDVWRENVFEKYQQRPSTMHEVSLAQFVASYYKNARGEYQKRQTPKIIRYINYPITNLVEYKREMVLLHIPFKNEECDLLDCNKFLQIYEDNEQSILEARKEFESDIDIGRIMEYCRQLCIEGENNDIEEERISDIARTTAVNNDFIEAMRNANNDDINIGAITNMESIVRRRENVMTAENYCCAMRQTNMEQRDLILEAIYRIFNDNHSNPIQIFFTGPAGCGKTFTMKLLMETYNRFSQHHNCNYNAYVASASTGMAASALNGSTVHSVFRISNNNVRREMGLSFELVNSFRAAFSQINIVFIDECSMIGSGLLNQINSRLQQIFHNFEKPFGNMNIILCGDLRQLPPVCQSPIYKRSRSNLSTEIIWQSLQYYPLVQVMRQTNIAFSSLLTKIGEGKALNVEEKELIESRFFTSDYVNANFPNTIRLFFKTQDVIQYNDLAITGDDVVQHVAQDVYTGHTNVEQLASARTKVHKMKPDETGGLPYMLKLLIGKPYMIRTNIDVMDGLVNGAIGTLVYIERNTDAIIKRLWFSFKDDKIGKVQRSKCEAYVRTNSALQRSWVPIGLHSSSISLRSRIIHCKRTQFPLLESSAITIHKSQGGTYDAIVYEYSKSHEQQLVYVALSRATSLEGLYITNSAQDHRFYHARGNTNRQLQDEFSRLEQHKLKTIGESCREFLESANTPNHLTLCIFNTQSLHAHAMDISTDNVLTKVAFLALSETWVENDDNNITVSGFRKITHLKRNSVRNGGVMILVNEASEFNTLSSGHNLLSIQHQRTAVTNEPIGDICAVEIKVGLNNIFLINVYINPGATLNNIKNFIEINLLAYSPIAAVFPSVRARGYDTIPIIMCGDFNINLKGEHGEEFIKFMDETFNLRLQNDPNISTTRNNTCIDAIFSRNLSFRTISYISYFSYHRPILAITEIGDTTGRSLTTS